MAGSLAGKVVEAPILATRSGPGSSREDVLDDLLDKGRRAVVTEEERWQPST